MEPAKGNEFCRVGVVCHLHLTISSRVPPTEVLEVSSVMYEVLAEQSVWAVCGRTAGVVSFNEVLGNHYLLPSEEGLFNVSFRRRLFRTESCIRRNAAY